MADENKVDSQQAPCACGSSCDCGPSAAGRTWIRTIIAAIILLAAVGVGAYSLLTNRTATSPAAAGTSVAPAAPAAVQPTPTGRAPCCAGQAATEAPAKPRCCAGGGGAPAGSPAAQPSCGGAGPACCGGR